MRHGFRCAKFQRSNHPNTKVGRFGDQIGKETTLNQKGRIKLRLQPILTLVLFRFCSEHVYRYERVYSMPCLWRICAVRITGCTLYA